METSPPVQDKKRHHFVPIAYLSQFTDELGKVFAYIADGPEEPQHMKPDAIGFEGYYYSQIRPDGTRDANTVEDLFGTVETKWSPIMERIRKRLDLTADIETVMEFMTLQRVRVPAARDLIETNLAGVVMATLRQMDAQGALPPKPEGFEDILDHIVVPIDPQMSLTAMGPMAQGMIEVVDRLGFQIVHLDDQMDGSFITSDNPVVFFDPTVQEDRLRPYHWRRPSGAIELLFPLSPRTLLRGYSDLRLDYQRHGLRHVKLTSRQEAKRINRLVAKFGYRLIFAKDRSHDRLVTKYLAERPTGKSDWFAVPSGTVSTTPMVFGRPPVKPKWTPRTNGK